MSPTARRIVRIASILVALLVILVLGLPYVVSLDSVRARVISAAESALHRKVEAGAILSSSSRDAGPVALGGRLGPDAVRAGREHSG